MPAVPFNMKVIRVKGITRVRGTMAMIFRPSGNPFAIPMVLFPVTPKNSPNTTASSTPHSARMHFDTPCIAKLPICSWWMRRRRIPLMTPGLMIR